jgi:hypothetical protein
VCQRFFCREVWCDKNTDPSFTILKIPRQGQSTKQQQMLLPVRHFFL